MSIAELLLRQGDVQAQGLREGGRIYGQLASQLGQLPGRTYGQVLDVRQDRQAQDERAQRMKLQQQQIDTGAANEARLAGDEKRKQQAQQDQEAVDTTLSQALNPDGSYNRAAAMSAATPATIAELTKAIDDAEKNAADVRAKKASLLQTEASTLKAQQEIAKLDAEHWGEALQDVKASGYNPTVLAHAIAFGHANGFDPQPIAAAIASGRTVQEVVDGYLAGSTSQRELAAKEATAARLPRPPLVTNRAGIRVPDVQGVEVPQTAGAQADEIDLSQDAVRDTAMRYHLFGASAIPTRINERDRKLILNENAKINTALGQSPAVAIQKQLALKADAASLTRATTLADASRAAQSKAEPQADLIVQLSDKVGRTKWPILNKAILAGKTTIEGDTDATLLLGALTEFTAEYAKIIEGSANSSAGASVESRKQAHSLVTAAMSKGTVKAQIAQMKQIMNWAIQGYDATIEGIGNRMTASGTPAAAPPGDGKTPAPTKIGRFEVVAH